MKTVAVCLLLEDKRWELSKRLFDSWIKTDFGNNNVVIVTSVTDLNEKNRNEYERLISEYDHINIDINLDAIRTSVPITYYVTAIRMGLLRNAVRKIAVEKYNPDWLFWIDSDNQHEENAFIELKKVFDSTKGLLKPHTVSGVYPMKNNDYGISESMPCYWGGESEDGTRKTLLLKTNKIMATGYNGFGCLLMSGECAKNIDWDNYLQYRNFRRDMLEAGNKAVGFLGDDTFFLRKAEDFYGVPHYIHTGVISKHWSDKENRYWKYIESNSVISGESILQIGEFYNDELIKIHDTVKRIL